MKQTHYLKTKGGVIYLIRKSDGGIAFKLPNSIKGRVRALLLLERLHNSYDEIFFRLKFHLERKDLEHLLLPEHFPD